MDEKAGSGQGAAAAFDSAARDPAGGARLRAGPEHWTAIPAEEASEVIVAAMALGGVDHLFFNSGSEVMFFQEGIAKAQAQGRPAPRLILVTHEYATLNAALGYAAVTGKPAATTAHVDVGTQHYGAAVHTAMFAGLPILITAGAPPTAYPGSMRGARDGSHFWLQQRSDQAGIVRQYVKWDHRLDYQDNPGLIVSRALQIAQSEPRGPVYLSLPREISFLPADGARFPTAAQLGISRPPGPDPQAVRELAERLVKARNPVAIVARSGRNPATLAPLTRLCELLGMPVAEAAARAYHCFPMDHPLYQSTSAPQRDADFVLVLEADVPWVPGRDDPPGDAYVAVVDIDPIKAHIGTYEFAADMRLTADARLTLEALVDEVTAQAGDEDRARFAKRTESWARVTRRRLAQAAESAKAEAAKTPVSPLWLSYQIGQAMDENCLMLDETLMLSPLPPYLRFREPGTYFRNPGSAGGWAAGAALGAKLGCPDKDVVAVGGDGFYMYSAANAAILAAVRYKAPFMSVIYQNHSYSTGTSAAAAQYPEGYAVKSGLEGGYFDPGIDFAKEAEAAGALGVNVEAPAEVEPALRRGLDAIRNGTPAVVSVRVPRILSND